MPSLFSARASIVSPHVHHSIRGAQSTRVWCSELAFFVCFTHRGGEIAAEYSQIANQKGGVLRSYVIKLSYNDYLDDHKVDADVSLDVNWYFDCRDSRLSFRGINGRV